MAPEVWARPVGEWTQSTHPNGPLKPLWGKAENSTGTSDGCDRAGLADVSGELRSGEEIPDGGLGSRRPGRREEARWPGTFDMSTLSSQGYFVLLPNPRGSYGAGEAFTGERQGLRLRRSARHRGRRRRGARSVADRSRTALGITGWSYGGYMTMWAVTQTTRFKAAVAGAGIANWQSYYGQNLIDQWMIPYFGASVYDDPGGLREELADHLHQEGEDADADRWSASAMRECPAPQSYEFWHALKTLGVKTQLVVYPDEGHAARSRNIRRIFWSARSHGLTTISSSLKACDSLRAAIRAAIPKAARIGSAFGTPLPAISKVVPCAGVVIGAGSPPGSVTPREKTLAASLRSVPDRDTSKPRHRNRRGARR